MLPAHPPNSHLPDTGALYTLVGSGRRNLFLDPHRYRHSYTGSGSRVRGLQEHRRPFHHEVLCIPALSSPLTPPSPALPCPLTQFSCVLRKVPLAAYLSHSAVQRSLEGNHTCICQCSGNKYHHYDRGQRHTSLAFLEAEDKYHRSQPLQVPGRCSREAGTWWSGLVQLDSGWLSPISEHVSHHPTLPWGRTNLTVSPSESIRAGASVLIACLLACAPIPAGP